MASHHRHLCPHCGGPSHLRSSKSITPLYRVLYFICRDPECGHSYRGELTLLETLSPSARPNPKINLPIKASGRPQLALPGPAGLAPA